MGKKIKDDQVELSNVFHKDTAGEISGLPTEKATPVAGDWILINDSADANNVKKAQVGNLPGGGGTESPLTTKGDIYVYGTENQRLPADGDDGDVLTLDSAEETGLKWAAPTGGSGTGADPNEDEFTTDGTETPGATVTFGPLSATPRGSGTAATPSGYDISVFRNGIRMKYSATPSTYMHFYYDSANNEVDVLAPGSADEYSVVYGS